MSVAGTAFSAIDHAHMARALRLAERGMYTTQPNPRVGCVVAHGDEIVGEGWHERAGEPHAEVFALRAAGMRARGATAYVTLEPCGLCGRTPPCADALIAAQVARVVIASEDAFQREGGAVARLRTAGIAVESGLLREAARELNRGFFSRIERGRPWLRVKLAMSLDGRTALANGESKWITGEAAREDVQRWRARSSAILTGIGSVLADDPRLTVRCASLLPPGEGARRADEGKASQVSEKGQQPSASPSSGASRHLPPAGEGKTSMPLRVVLDRNLRTPRAANVLDGSAPTLVFHAADAKPVHEGFAHAELVWVEARDGRLDVAQVLDELGRRGVNELQVEAGPTLCGALLQGGFVDEWLLYTAPVALGDKARPLLAMPELTEMTQAKRLRVVDRRQIGDDTRILYRE
ncbi:MAG: bifunctional diaminohydroxyphosphoribosylaminopyrimidine deaminase/5-amino-6-(5-phosphoribosylamino)uracil reductase RibD [Rudaea sp.]|uniref:bifunctional diaminohydroxyphosphoribosylaminopyrimidine deaminase/5-amino-6-(5-phosphoribosylamino)uracil reductase RibD n=1 Tax=Rudaea sp. TaxID=2136325 RepID=UPI0039E33C00